MVVMQAIALSVGSTVEIFRMCRVTRSIPGREIRRCEQGRVPKKIRAQTQFCS